MEFLVLGPLEIRGPDGPVDLRSGRQRALLAVLLLHPGEVLSTDRLVQELWGDEPPDSAEHALEVHVSGLRAVLGREVIETRPPGYRLASALRPTDLDRFEALASAGIAEADAGRPERSLEPLREAVRLWRGEPIEDVATGVARAERVRLESLRDFVVERRLDAELATGRHLEVLPDLRGLVREHPLREGLHEQLMLALYRSGRQGEALAAYEDAKRVLKAELGVDPGPELQQLIDAIRSRDQALDLAPRDAPKARPVREILATHVPSASINPAIAMATLLARPTDHALVMASLTPPDPAALAAAHATLAGAREEQSSTGLAVRVAAHTTRDWARDVAELASRLDVDLMLLARAPGVIDLPADSIRALRLAACDVLLVPELRHTGDDRPVVVPFGGSDHDWLALETGAWIVRGSARPLWICGRIGGSHGDPDDRPDSSRLLADASLLLQRTLGVEAVPRLTASGIDGIADVANDAGIVIAGLSDRWETEGIGTSRRTLVDRAPVPVVFARRGIRPGAVAPDAALSWYTWSVAGSIA